MYDFDLSEPKSVHFIGIGGISMSGLAEILLERGFKVTGSDRQESQLTKALKPRALAFATLRQLRMSTLLPISSYIPQQSIRTILNSLQPKQVVKQ